MRTSKEVRKLLGSKVTTIREGDLYRVGLRQGEAHIPVGFSGEAVAWFASQEKVIIDSHNISIVYVNQTNLRIPSSFKIGGFDGYK